MGPDGTSHASYASRVFSCCFRCSCGCCGLAQIGATRDMRGARFYGESASKLIAAREGVCAVNQLQCRGPRLCRNSRSDPLTHSIAPMTTTSGRQVGPLIRSSGAAASMDGVALHLARDTRPARPTRTIAILVLPIG